MLEAARDLGASRFETFRRVTWPLSRPAVVVSRAGDRLPMLGDYFTDDLLSGSPRHLDGRQPDQQHGARHPARPGRRAPSCCWSWSCRSCRCCSTCAAPAVPETDMRRRERDAVPWRGCALVGDPWRQPRFLRLITSATCCGRCCRCSSPCCSRSTPAGRGPRGRASRCGGTRATRMRSVWHDDSLHTALIHTLCSASSPPRSPCRWAWPSRSGSTAGGAGCRRARTS